MWPAWITTRNIAHSGRDSGHRWKPNAPSTVGERHQEVGQLGVGAMLGNEHLDALTPAPPARVAQDRERRGANVARFASRSMGRSDAMWVVSCSAG